MPQDLSGRTVGHFSVDREIGRGGMGVVYLARQTSLDRPAVLKQLRRELAENEELCQRFEREARAAASVHHQNVVAVYDCFRFRGDAFIAQEFVEGLDLHAALERAGSLPPRIAALVALEIARGLEEIHARGTVHRDLKPHNVLLGQRGEVKIADFGIALEASGPALTMPGMAIGSPPYMPPEHMAGERVDARGDLFSLGVVLYEMLAGRTPYAEPREDDEESLSSRMRKERYPRVRRVARGTPRWLARLVRRCLRGRAQRRPASSTRVRQELEARLGQPSPADVRAELAAWLWERQVFETAEGATVVRIASTPSVRRGSLAGWALGGLAAAALVGSLMWIRVQADGLTTTLDRAPYVSIPSP